MEALSTSLSDLAAGVFRWAAIAFLIINGAAAVGVWITRDRRLVNRLTSPLLAANLLLLGAGLGVPALAYTMKLVVNAVATTTQPSSTITIEGRPH